MGSIPVGQSVGDAYGFLFRRFLTIIGLSWLPAVIYAVGRLGFLWHVEPRLLAEVHGGGHLTLPTILLLIGYILLALLLASVIAVALTRDALDLRDQPVLARLVIGPRELRLFAAYICIDIIVILLCALLAGGVFGAMWLAKWGLAQGAPLAGWPVLKIVHVAASVIAVLILLFVSLRLSFLIAAVAAAEDKARLSRAWELSGGNFWRMLAVVLAIIVPVLIAVIIGEYAVLGPQIAALHQAAGARRDPSIILVAAIAHGPVLVTIAAVAMVVLSALFAGASASAYRALVPQPRRETEDFVEPVEPPVHVSHEPAHEPEPVAEETPHSEAPAEHAIVETEQMAEAPHETHGEPEHHEDGSHDAGHNEPEHHASAEPQTGEASHGVEPASEEPAMELNEATATSEAHQTESVPPPPEIPEDPGAHVH